MPVAAPDIREDTSHAVIPERPPRWQTLVWNDPVNLMSYVTHVFQHYFRFPAATATKLMLDVHERGHAVVAEGPREQMELHAQAMHDFGLWATVRRATE